MKRVVLFSIGLVFFSCIVLGQSQRYHSIFENQKQWDLSVLDFASGQTAPVSQFVAQDTLVAGQSLLLLRERTAHGNAKGILIREDEASEKVYIVGSGGKMLLYDFALKAGDKFAIKDLSFAVIAVSEIKLNDSWRKQIELQCTSKLADNMVWIEGVGSTVSPLYYEYYADPARTAKVACLFKGTNLEYSLSDQPCSRQLFAGDQEDAGFDINLAPNPFSDQIQLRINNPGDDKVTIRLIGTAGQELYVEELSNPGQNFETRLDFQDLKAGIYFLNISSIRHQMTQKVIKY